jgi:hypothetical protein
MSGVEKELEQLSLCTASPRFDGVLDRALAELTSLRTSNAELLAAAKNALHVLTPAQPKMDGLDRTRMWLTEAIAHAHSADRGRSAELTRLRTIVQRVRDELGPQLCAGRYGCPCALITATTPEEIPHENNCLYVAAGKALNSPGET